MSANASAMYAYASFASRSPCSRVVEHHAAARDGAGRVREVVGHDLVPVELGDRDAAVVGRASARCSGAAVDERGGGVDGRARPLSACPSCGAAYRRARPAGPTRRRSRASCRRRRGRRGAAVASTLVVARRGGARRRDPGCPVELAAAPSMVACDRALAPPAAVIRHAGSSRRSDSSTVAPRAGRRRRP